jgi:hypothetical protein
MVILTIPPRIQFSREVLMINITRCFQDIRLLKAVTGTTAAEFNALLPDFERALTPTTRRGNGTQAGGDTIVSPPGGRSSFLSCFT